jgi:hypothetical protein
MKLSAMLLAISISSIWGSDWQELPCKSEAIDNVKLEANSGSLRISSGEDVLTTIVVCHPQNQLVDQLKRIIFRECGVFVIRSEECNLVLDYLPTYSGLTGRVGGRFASRACASAIKFGGAASCVITLARDVLNRIEGQYETTVTTTVTTSEGNTQTTT